MLIDSVGRERKLTKWSFINQLDHIAAHHKYERPSLNALRLFSSGDDSFQAVISILAIMMDNCNTNMVYGNYPKQLRMKKSDLLSNKQANNFPPLHLLADPRPAFVHIKKTV